jgi:hypothetical protein
MSITLEEFTIEIVDFGPEYAQVMEQNLVIAVEDRGIGQYAEAPLEVRVASSADASLKIGTGTSRDSVSPYAVPIPGGSILIYWDELPRRADVDYATILGSLTQDGTYITIATLRGSKGGIIHNVPVGITIYLKLQFISRTGDIDYTPQAIARGRISSGNITCEIRAIKGSVIPKGAMFSVSDFDMGAFTVLKAIDEISVTDSITLYVESFIGEIDFLEHSLTNNIVVAPNTQDLDIDLLQVEIQNWRDIYTESSEIHL